MTGKGELRPFPSGHCPHRCGYFYPIPACVRLHLMQHHDYTYAEAQEAYPDE